MQSPVVELLVMGNVWKYKCQFRHTEGAVRKEKSE